ncbi:aminotransferase-like domain-containing protein [Flexivirga sp. B27]
MIEELSQRLSEPTARGLADAVAGAVAAGSVDRGARLPPIRSVADGLQLSPTTVSSAWAILRRAGTIRTQGRHGSFIAERADARPNGRYRRAVGDPVRFALDLSTGVPDQRLLPSWGNALRALGDGPAMHSYLDDPVVPELAEIVLSSWPCSPERLTITDGATDAMAAILAQLGGFGTRVAIENPAFPPFLDLLESYGMRPIPVELDAHGLVPASLHAALTNGAELVVLQPRGQNPTGVSLTAQRARELAEIIAPTSVHVIEDDSLDGIAATPLVSLSTLLPDRVLHIRSFSKAYGPDLRLAAIGGPTQLVGPLQERRQLGQGWSSRLLQRLLVRLLSDPASLQEVQAARAAYSSRRRELVEALAAEGVTVGGDDGINIWVPVLHEVSALQSLAANGIGAAAGSPFHVTVGTDDQVPHIRVTAGLVATNVAQVASALGSAARVGGSLAR